MSPREQEDRVGRVLAELEERFGLTGLPEGVVLIPSGKRRYRLASGKAATVSVARTVGIYAIKETPMGPLLSLEGTQILGPLARKNVVSLPEELLDAWMRGEDLEVGDLDGAEPGLVILRFGALFAGCGLYSPPRVKNLIPLTRRVVPRGE